MKVIRRSVFETNSSSMHSLSIRGEDSIVRPESLTGRFGEFGWGYEELTTPKERLSYLLTAIAVKTISLEDEEPMSEAVKLFTNCRFFRWTNELVKDFLGTEIIFDWEFFLMYHNDYHPFGYIDHQSIEDEPGIADIFREVYINGQRSTGIDGYKGRAKLRLWSNNEKEFKRNMKEFIFNNKFVVIIDNDNH